MGSTRPWDVQPRRVGSKPAAAQRGEWEAGRLAGARRSSASCILCWEAGSEANAMPGRWSILNYYCGFPG